MNKLKAPFPYPGGKSIVAPLVWRVFGNPKYYFEPFCGSCAVLLGRPGWRPGIRWNETVNDKYGHIANFWRAVQNAPEEVLRAAQQPPFENDFHAWHVRCLSVEDDLVAKLEGDPYYFDAEIAGRWAWGMSICLGNTFMRRGGPWWVDEEGKLVPQFKDGVERSVVSMIGRGVTRAKPKADTAPIQDLTMLAERFRYVRVLCGDWQRALPIKSLWNRNDVAVFLDPPYSAKRDMRVYSKHDSSDIAIEVRDWCKQHGQGMKIAICGLDSEHDELLEYGWTKIKWKASTGWRSYAGGANIDENNPNRLLERIWFSPVCKNGDQLGLWEVE